MCLGISGCHCGLVSACEFPMKRADLQKISIAALFCRWPVAVTDPCGVQSLRIVEKGETIWKMFKKNRV